MTLGAAYGETDGTLSVAARGTASTLNIATVSGGFTWGTGIEAALDGNWSAKAEYLYVDLGDINCGFGCGLLASDHASFSTHIVRGGLNFRF